MTQHSASKLLILGFAFLASSAYPAAPLKVGSPAPPIKVARWLKGAPVNELMMGQVYVVEFWATWCGPCMLGISALTNVAKTYRDQVNVVGVSVHETDRAKVAPFVDKMDFHVAMDRQKKPNHRDRLHVRTLDGITWLPRSLVHQRIPMRSMTSFRSWWSRTAGWPRRPLSSQ